MAEIFYEENVRVFAPRSVACGSLAWRETVRTALRIGLRVGFGYEREGGRDGVAVHGTGPLEAVALQYGSASRSTEVWWTRQAFVLPASVRARAGLAWTVGSGARRSVQLLVSRRRGMQEPGLR